MYTEQRLADRQLIQDLLVDYCTAIDTRQFDDLDRVFTPDAWIDYTCFGGPKGRYPEIKQFLVDTLPKFPAYYHMIANTRVHFEGEDQANSRCICHNPMSMPTKRGTPQVAFYGLWYVDKLLNTAEGWRIAERVEEPCYIHNVPEDFVLPE